MPEIRGNFHLYFLPLGYLVKSINHRMLRSILKEKGFKIIGKFTCRGYGANGLLEKIGRTNKRCPSLKTLKELKICKKPKTLY
ncbi:MAG: hypothetical protein J7K58_04700 [Euryarchaeota archaeon]|nr:hypothetical protein [Euryarchaeota archaeon]